MHIGIYIRSGLQIRADAALSHDHEVYFIPHAKYLNYVELKLQITCNQETKKASSHCERIDEPRVFKRLLAEVQVPVHERKMPCAHINLRGRHGNNYKETKISA